MRNKTLGHTMTYDMPQLTMKDVLKHTSGSLLTTLTPTGLGVTERHNYQGDGASLDMRPRVTYTFKQFRKDSVKDHTKAILPTVRKLK